MDGYKTFTRRIFLNNIDSTGKGNQLIKNTYTGIFVINAVAMISAMLCQIVDAVVTGQFLGTAAVAAYGLITPIVMLANLLCNLLGPGVNIICTRHMGKARPDRCNQVFSIVMIADMILVISAAIPPLTHVSQDILAIMDIITLIEAGVGSVLFILTYLYRLYMRDSILKPIAIINYVGYGLALALNGFAGVIIIPGRDIFSALCLGIEIVEILLVALLVFQIIFLKKRKNK